MTISHFAIMLFSLCLFFTPNLYASPAVDSASSTNNYTLGVSGGSTTGLGLTFRHEVDSFYYQLAAAPAYDVDSGGKLFAGLQAGYRFQGDSDFYLNASFGLAVMYDYDPENCQWYPRNLPDGAPDPDDPGYEVCTKSKDIYMGIGPSIGIGKVFAKHLHIEVNIPLALVFTKDLSTPGPMRLKSFLPFPGLLIGYRFN